MYDIIEIDVTDYTLVWRKRSRIVLWEIQRVINRVAPEGGIIELRDGIPVHLPAKRISLRARLHAFTPRCLTWSIYESPEEEYVLTVRCHYNKGKDHCLVSTDKTNLVIRIPWYTRLFRYLYHKF